MGRATGCSDRQENHFGFQSVSPSCSCPLCGVLRLDLGINCLDALTLSQSTEQERPGSCEVTFQKMQIVVQKKHSQIILQLCYVSQAESNGQPDITRARHLAAMRSSL